MNAVTHGLLSQYTVMSGEDADQFEALRTMLCEEFKPVGGYEETLATLHDSCSFEGGFARWPNPSPDLGSPLRLV
jgi:hypothetical protein